MCLPCDPRCKSCVGRTNYCVSGCESPYLFKDHRCLSDCGTGYTAVSGQCESCDTDCLACSYNSTSESKVCTECGNGKLLHLGTCVQLCPAGYYADPPAGECRACSVECTKCLAAGNKACTACNTAEGYTMIATNVCDFPTCAKGTYFNRTLRSCKGRWRKRDSRVDCRTECAECYGLNNCTACVKGYLLDGKTALCRDECSKLGYKRMPVTFECVGTFRDCGSDRVEILYSESGAATRSSQGIQCWERKIQSASLRFPRPSHHRIHVMRRRSEHGGIRLRRREHKERRRLQFHVCG